MTIPGNATALLLPSINTQYKVERSLRFNSSDSAYLSRTPASAGNRKTWTWAGWVKRSVLGTVQDIFSASDGSSGEFTLRFLYDGTDTDCIQVVQYIGGYVFQQRTSSFYRDVSAWYHIVCAVDTTQSTDANKIKLYVNGIQVTAFSTVSYPSLNADLLVNSANLHTIGRQAPASQRYFNGYLSECHFIDGQQLTPSSFAETDATTGQWIPKLYSGSYGTNGFKLTFADNSAATASTLGKDSSGNGLNWTPNNFSVTAGAGNDSLVDTPTSYGTDTGAGGEVRGNYCTFNPLSTGGSTQTSTLSNGNLDFTSTSGSGTYANRYSTFAVSSGKWYAEFTLTASTNSPFVGVTTSPDTKSSFIAEDSDGWAYFKNGTKWNSNSSTAYGASWTVNDVIGVALDIDSGTLVFYKNGVSQGTAYSGLPAGSYFFGVSGTPGEAFTVNFGQRPFAYTAPSGFKALCDTNLPAPVVAKPSTVMDVKLYTGNGSTQTISGLGFSPDLVWLKGRNTAYFHQLYDQIRGVQKAIYSNDTSAELTETTGLTAFGTDGFTLSSGVGVNGASGSYVAWTWDAGSSTVTNTAGSITSSVRANTSAGFSVVTYTGSGSAATIGHGLGVAPSMIIVKSRTNTWNWVVYHASVGNASVLALNTTAAAATYAAFANTTPTSTVFSLTGGADRNGVNVSAETHVAYCFAPVAGYSSFGSYTGNGSADGPFVYTGFRPKFVLIKGSSFVSNWNLLDGVRDSYNVADKILRPNLSNAELNSISAGSGFAADFLSNGFKLRASLGDSNSNAETFVWAAFAESPFAYSRAR